MNKTIISNHQLFTLTSMISLGGATILASIPMVTVAKQDAYLGVAVSALYSLLIILMYYTLGRLFPGLTLVGIAKQILGKWAGAVVAILFVFYFLILSSHLPWYIMDFMNHVMHETPPYMILLLFIAAFAVGALYGIETIARAAEILLKFVNVLFVLSMVMVIPNAKPDNLFPVLEKGVIPIVKSSFYLSTLSTIPLVSLLMIFPLHVSDTKSAKKSLLKGYLWATLITFITIVVLILVLGSSLIPNLKYPTFILLKEINVANLFTRLEYFIFVLWTVTLFSAGATFFYSCATSLAEVCKLKNYKLIVLPLALIVYILVGVAYPNDVYNKEWLGKVSIPYYATMGVLIPLLLLIVHYSKKIFKQVFE